MKPLFLTILGLVFIVDAGAQLGPDYVRPDTETVQWRTIRPLDTHPRGEWWACFRDSKLNALMDDATRHNQSLKAAIARFDQARAAARIARGNFFPSLSSGNIFAQRQRTSENMPSAYPLNGLFYDGPAYEVPLDFSWEIDLWGKVRRQHQSGVADAGAAAAEMHNVLLGIHADVATNYFRLRALDEEIATVIESIDLRRQALDIASARVEAGAGSEIEEAQAETEVAIAESELASLRSQREQLKNAIAILVGANASRFEIAARDSGCPAPPRVPTGLQSDLLERRPDIAAAERRLESATAQIGAAKGLMFPSIKLMGTGGWQSGDIDVLFEANSLNWRIGPSLSFPIFSGGKSRSKLEQVRAAHDAALADYRQAFIIAVAGVENSVAALKHLEIQIDAQTRAKTSAPGRRPTRRPAPHRHRLPHQSCGRWLGPAPPRRDPRRRTRPRFPNPSCKGEEEPLPTHRRPLPQERQNGAVGPEKWSAQSPVRNVRPPTFDSAQRTVRTTSRRATSQENHGGKATRPPNRSALPSRKSPTSFFHPAPFPAKNPAIALTHGCPQTNPTSPPLPHGRSHCWTRSRDPIPLCRHPHRH